MRHNKSALLTIVAEAVDSGEISAHDLLNIIEAQKKPAQSTSVNKLLYYLGGIIILLGLSILVGNYWTGFTTTVHLFIAVGVPLVAYGVGIVLAEEPRFYLVATPFFLLFTVLLPFAFAVGFYEAHALSLSFNASYLMGLSFLACLWAFRCYSRTELLVFVIFYASAYYLSLLKYWHYFEASAWATEYHWVGLFLLGGVYAFYLWRAWLNDRPGLAKALSRIGMMMVLFSLLTLRAKTMAWHGLWEVMMILMLIMNFALSLWRKDLFLKVLGFIVFIVYVLNFSYDYFAHSLGWTLALIIAGLIIITGTFTLRTFQKG